eukprot:TRINITY_DN61464_c0_g1_i1.p3 TRINITY_DN61464_c0_g1~~TRINITY_DN61464_c0_g1_i1.p3  ORF type:complete len:307 (+),score=144.20 TRINITY_DN61464_c0_g1_i1:81-923(+)
MAESRSREDVVHELQKLFRWIREELDSEACVLWQLFLNYDESLDGHIDSKELDLLLKDFDPSATPERLDRYREQLRPKGGGSDHGLTFADFCMWWHNVKHAPQEESDSGDSPGMYHAALLRAKYVGQLTASVTWDLVSDDKVSKRIKEATMEELKDAVHQYRRTYFELKTWLAQSRQEAVLEEEQKLRKQAEQRHAESGSPFSAVEQRQLRFLFDSLSRGSGQCRIQQDLPQLCAVLKYDVPVSVLDATAKVYQRDYLTLDEFYLWWAARPQSGKTSLFG